MIEPILKAVTYISDQLSERTPRRRRWRLGAAVLACLTSYMVMTHGIVPRRGAIGALLAKPFVAPMQKQIEQITKPSSAPVVGLRAR